MRQNGFSAPMGNDDNKYWSLKVKVKVKDYDARPRTNTKD